MKPIPTPEDDGTVQVCVVLGSDNEVAAAAYTDHVETDPEYYFSQTLQECETWSIGLLWLPAELAAQIVAQGTSDQHFGDGYEAQQALVATVPGQMEDDSLWNEGGEEAEEDSDECDGGCFFCPLNEGCEKITPSELQDGDGFLGEDAPGDRY